jgi:cytochrome c biogenesis protein CcmG, thiol:disulfide interchange protein DsbE
VSRALFIALAVALAVLRSPAARSDILEVGQSAPAFLINTLDGTSVTGNFNGRPAYINVFATWCSPCRVEFPAIVEQTKQYGDRIAFLLVDEQESANTVKTFAREFGVVAPVAVDRGQFAAAFDVGGLPWSIFIDRHGIVRYIYRGRIPANVLGDQLSKLASS